MDTFSVDNKQTIIHQTFSTGSWLQGQRTVWDHSCNWQPTELCHSWPGTMVLQNLFEEEELEEEDSDVDSDAYEGDESESDDDED